MAVMELLVPFAMLGFGGYYKNHAPKEINCWNGYRTERSMKNKDTWVFAHHDFGARWEKLGWLALLLTAAALPFSFGKSEDDIGVYGLAIIAVQTVFLILPIFQTEAALKRTFDENGFRRNV